MRAGRVAPLAALALWAAPAAAQGELAMGRETVGSLAATDPRTADGAHYDAWSFQGTRGHRVIITLSARAFSGHVSLGTVDGGRYHELAGHGDTRDCGYTLVIFDLPETRTYVVRATSRGPGTGPYSLTVEPVEPYHLESIEGALEAGDPQAGDGTYYDAHTYHGRGGERLVVVMGSPDAGFDAHLAIGAMDGGRWTRIAADDNGAGGRDARVEIRLPHTRVYVIRAGSRGSTGRYWLKFESGPPPRRCDAARRR
ncbi:MAG TPA: hypothetical protein VFQ45_06490 [Longimicrobium sp.]|nr:hypothetical protein [Longimicrobium sp.]